MRVADSLGAQCKDAPLVVLMWGAGDRTVDAALSALVCPALCRAFVVMGWSLGQRRVMLCGVDSMSCVCVVRSSRTAKASAVPA